MVKRTRAGPTSASEEVGNADVEDLQDRCGVLWPVVGERDPASLPYEQVRYGRGPLIAILKLLLVQLKGRSVGTRVRAYVTNKLAHQDRDS